MIYLFVFLLVSSHQSEGKGSSVSFTAWCLEQWLHVVDTQYVF